MENTPGPLIAVLQRHYGLSGSLRPLGGENENFCLEVGDGRRFVVKLNALNDDGRAAVEHEIVERALPAMGDVRLPRVVPTRDNELFATWQRPDGSAESLRVLTYIDGTPWEQAPPATPARLRDLGRVLATFDRALESLTPPLAAMSHRWDLTSAGQHRARVRFIETADRRRLAERMFHWWAALAAPRLNQLPHSVIHGDANDENVLVDADRVSGVLDLGDALVNPTVCDLAIALAYAMLETSDPLAAAAAVVAGYQSVRPLHATELDVLFPLVCGRLATTVVTAAERRQIDRSHRSWFITEDKAWRLIAKLAAIDPQEARDRLGHGPQATGHGLQTRGDRRGGLVASRHVHLSRALSIAYREPLEIVRGEGQYLFDRRGRAYLDLVNNVCHVGHCHPRVVEAAHQQMARLNTNTRYLYDQLTDYAGRLAATLPAPLVVCFFVNSGSEANELALRLARAHTARRDVLVVEGAYHGNTNTLIEVSPYKFLGKGGTGVAEPWVHVAPVPDGYRGRRQGVDRNTGEAYGADVAEMVNAAGSRVGAFLVESLMSCAGQIVPPPGYLQTAFRAVRSAGGVCIVDEVQVGFGRVGSHFWGFELQQVVPDIVVMGKPIGNGHPLGAVVTTPEIAASFENGMEFFSTFGGNPVSCAVGLAVLDVIRDEQLQARAQSVGTRLADGLRALSARHELIGDVRGAGLFLGVELVRDRQTREPATAEAADLINRMKDRGVLLSTDGPFENVLKIKPPMVLTEADVDMVVRLLDDELGVRS